jgi:sulfur-oxidizing protein SoxX
MPMPGSRRSPARCLANVLAAVLAAGLLVAAGHVVCLRATAAEVAREPVATDAGWCLAAAGVARCRLAAAGGVGCSPVDTVGARLCLAAAGGDAIDTPLTGQPGDPVRGRQIVENRTVSACLLCHSGPFPQPHLQGTIGPSLDGVGSRLSAGQVRLRLVDARKLNPDTTMPPYYVVEGLNRTGRQWQGRPALSAQQIEDVVAFMVSLRAP